VRGREIPFDRDSVNIFLNNALDLEPSPDPTVPTLCTYGKRNAQGSWKYEQIERDIMNKGRYFVRNDKGEIKHALTKEMNANDVPRAHTSDAPKAVLPLIWCIMKGVQADIARIIANEMKHVALKCATGAKKVALIFPGLIMGLLKANGVTISGPFDEDIEGTITDSAIRTWEQMPVYAKFMKDILSKKRRINDEETIQIDANCSAIIQRSLPKKEQDPGRVTLPVAIGTTNVGKALLDLGSSINLMPLSVAKRVGNLCIKRTRMKLQLADKSFATPLGMAEDVLVKVDKFVFPEDFVVMDLEEDEDVPLLMGRNFMQTARMMIDLDDNIMKVKVNDEEVTFNIREALKHSKDKGACFKMDATEEVILTTRKQLHKRTPLESVLMDALNAIDEDEAREIEECLKELDSLKKIPPHEAILEELKAESNEEAKVDDTKVELKVLPSNLKYVFLENDGTKPVVITSSLSIDDETKLVEILKVNKEAIGWNLSDLKGIRPSYCMHKIMMEENFKPVAQP
jgi:hypothetical protein